MIPCHRTSFSISSINLLHSCPSAIHKNNIVITTNMMRIQFLNFFNEKSNSFARFFAVSYFKWFLFVQTLTQHSTVSIIELLDVRVLYSTHLNLLYLSLPCITKFCTWGYVKIQFGRGLWPSYKKNFEIRYWCHLDCNRHIYFSFFHWTRTVICKYCKLPPRQIQDRVLEIKDGNHAITVQNSSKMFSMLCLYIHATNS